MGLHLKAQVYQATLICASQPYFAGISINKSISEIVNPGVSCLDINVPIAKRDQLHACSTSSVMCFNCVMFIHGEYKVE